MSDDDKRAADQMAKWLADSKRRTAEARVLLERALPHVPDELRKDIEKWMVAK